jgi:4-aminobutyrate aminotransferase
MSTLKERCQKVMPPAAARATDLAVVKGIGSYLITDRGDKILDFASGVAVCNIGHNHPEVVKAAKEQIENLIHGGHNVVYYEAYVQLAEKLVELTGGNTKVYFSNSGSEANEGAIKLAKYVTKRPGIIAFKGAFHGRTLGTVSITTSSSAYRSPYEGLLPSVYFADYPKGDEGYDKEHYINEFNKIFKMLVAPDSVAAIIIEPIIGEGGYIVPPKAFIKAIREICDLHGIKLIFDEIQTGFGRTGKMFASEHFGVTPDITTLAKGIASGFPLSAIIAKTELMDNWPAGAHGGTFGGNPVSCAASLATIKVLEETGLKNCEEMGKYFKGRLEELSNKTTFISDVRGIGLMLAIELQNKNGTPNAEMTAKVKVEALKKGVLLLTCGTYKNVVRFIAPTTVSKEEIDIVMEVLTNIFNDLQ